MTAETLELAVIAEKRDTGIVWQPHEWHAVAFRPKCEIDAPGRTDEAGRLLVGIAPLTLHRTEAENYLFNLSGGDIPAVYAVMSRPAGDDQGPALVALTCDPYEAQSFTLANDRIVDALPMSPDIETWVRGFVAAHYREEVFVKRKRKDKAPKAEGGGHGA